MASIQGILNPGPATFEPQLEANSILNQPVVTPTVTDWMKDKFSDTVMNNPTTNLLGIAQGRDSQKLNKDQLSMLYPDVDPNIWKDGANAFQAAMIVDKQKSQQRTAELEHYILGDNPNTLNRASAWTLGMMVDLGGGLTDPLTLTAFGQAGRVAEIMSTPLMKIAPAFMSKIATSRLGAGIAHEVAVNVLGETAVMYPLKKLVLDDYTKGEDTTLTETVTNAVGTALAFAGLKYIGGTLWAKTLGKNAGVEFVEKVKEENFNKAKDRANAHVNSDAANEATMQEAATHTVSADINDPPHSISDKMSEKAFTGEKSPGFSPTSQFHGVFEKNSGKSDYVGERFGDTHVFVSSPEAAQGLFDTLAKDGNVYGIYGHDGNIPTIDLDSEILTDHPDVLDIITDPMNMGLKFLDGLNDDSTLAEIFHKVNEAGVDSGMSGKDTVEMFNKINNIFAADGYEGTTHTEQVGKTKHTVLSVFDHAMQAEDLTLAHEGLSKDPIIPSAEESTDPYTTNDVKLADGTKISIENPIAEDDLYQDDPEFLKQLDLFNDSQYDTSPEPEEVPKMKKEIEDTITFIEEDLKHTMNLAETLDRPSLENTKIQDKIEKVKEDFKNNDPEQEHEVAKAVENCLRKH